MNVPEGFEDYLIAILWVSGLDDRSVYEFSVYELENGELEVE